MDVLEFFVNGKKVTVVNPDPKWTLLNYLRQKRDTSKGESSKVLTTRQGSNSKSTQMILPLFQFTCVEQKRPVVREDVVHVPFWCQGDAGIPGRFFVTTEGLGSIKSGLHPIQDRIAKSHGTQCGYCTPGFVMSTYALLRNNPNPSETELENAIKGNLCRCTGYRPILDGLRGLCGAENCCRQNGGGCGQRESGSIKQIEDLIPNESEFKPYDPTQDPVFPPELMAQQETYDASKTFTGERMMWYTPDSLDSLLNLKASNPGAVLVGGYTDIQYNVRQNGKFFPILVHATDRVGEMCGISVENSLLKIGSLETFTSLKQFCEQMADQNLLFRAILHMLGRFGDVQTRNAATIGGSIASGSVGSDSNALFACAGSYVVLQSRDRPKREVSMDAAFFRPGGGVNIEPDEVITHLMIPLLQEDEFIWYTKQSKRRDVDVALMNSAIKAQVDQDGNIVTSRFVFNGIALQGLTIVSDLPELLTGMPASDAILETLIKSTGSVLTSPPTDVSITQQYRISMVDDFWYRFVESLAAWRSAKEASQPFQYDDGIWTNMTDRQSSQMFEIKSENREENDLVGKPLAHLAAKQQTTGEAPFLDDIPAYDNELFGAFVTSTKAHATIKSIDYEEALKLEGVVKVYDSGYFKDRGSNKFAIFMVPDEVVFAENQVVAEGQPIAFVVASSRDIARRAAKLVKVDYEELPAITTIEDAIVAKSFLGDSELVTGNAEEALGQSTHVFEGELHMGGQKHFYMELPGALVVPKKEDGELEVTATTQSTAYVQNAVAATLGLAPNKVVVKVRRVGGGFGGKESRNLMISVATALAAHEYKIGCDDAGKVGAIKAEIYMLGGYSTDYSVLILDQVLRALAAQFKVPNLELKAIVCKTNTQSNTAMRGFGSPQGCFVAQHLINLVADKLHLDRKGEMHFHQEGDLTAWGYKIERSTLQRCWEEVQTNADYEKRLEAIQAFNKDNRLKKRGLYLMPLSFSVGFPVPFLNQGGALVMIYPDGSVSLNHGGVEMGQGLHTKMMQIASKALGIPLEKIHMAQTATDKVPNASSSAGSMTADLNGPAIVDACQILLKRLEPIRQSNPNMTWEEVCNAGYFSRVNLSAVEYNKLEFEGITNYLSYGAACTEVEIDVMSGENRIVRTDIVMDVGESLNPAIDIGQIEGAYVMGTGLFTTEDVQFSPDGHILVTGPGTYKVPNVGNAPHEFNVSLLRGAPNPRAVYSSKAIGEPPLLFGTSVFFAIREAIKAAREQIHSDQEFKLDPPATYAKIRIACSSSL